MRDRPGQRWRNDRRNKERDWLTQDRGAVALPTFCDALGVQAKELRISQAAVVGEAASAWDGVE
jgi:hypothetical protein